MLLLLGTDAAALFGYTGAVVQHTLGTATGHAVLLTALAALAGAAALVRGKNISTQRLLNHEIDHLHSTAGALR